MALTQLGWVVTHVADAETVRNGRALARIATESFDLILLSTDLPRVDALDFCDQVKRGSNGSVPVVLTGARVDSLAARDPWFVHAAGYVRKSTVGQELVAQVRALFPSVAQPGHASHTRIVAAPAVAEDEVCELPVDWEDAAEPRREVAVIDNAIDKSLEGAVDDERGRQLHGMATEVARLEAQIELERRAHAQQLTLAERALAAARAEKHEWEQQEKASVGAEAMVARLERQLDVERAAHAEQIALVENALGAAHAAKREREQQEHTRVVAQLTKALEDERALGNSRAADRTADRAADERALAALTAELKAVEACLGQIKAAHAAELAQLDRSLRHLLEQERAASQARLSKVDATSAQAIALAIHETRRAAQAEFDELVAAQGEQLAGERSRAASSRTALEVTLRAENATLLDERARLERAFAVDRAEKERELGQLASTRDEARAALVAERKLRSDAEIAGEDRVARAEKRLQRASVAAAASLADVEARFDAQRLEWLEQREEDAARSAKREVDLAQAEARRDALALEERRLRSELVGDREAHAAAIASATRTSEARLRATEAKLADAIAGMERAQASVAAATEARRRELASERDRAAARARDVDAEYSQATETLERRHAETVASLRSELRTTLEALAAERAGEAVHRRTTKPPAV